MTATGTGEVSWCNHPTRQAWLDEALIRMRPLFASAGWPLPDCVTIAVHTYPQNTTRFGDCRTTGCISAAIRINGSLRTPGQVLLTLMHEAVHAAVGTQHGHRGPFADLARRFGLVGYDLRKTATNSPAWRLRELLRHLEFALGAYPSS